MKTKTLLLTAALGVAGAATTIAQVYSVNAVGYVNSEMVADQFNLIANPLDDGNNNTVENLFASAPDGIIIYKYANGAYENANAKDPDLGWDNPGQTLEPGEGAFVLTPAGENFTITFVGEVRQGLGANAPTTPLVEGFNMVSSQVPQAGLIATDLGFPAQNGDLFYKWNAATGEYASYALDPDLGWDPTEPTVAVGEAFWALTVAKDWVREFSVNQ